MATSPQSTMAIATNGQFKSNIDYSTSFDNPPTSPCKCCPYGFHIDTDFVRYCDALLTTLYGNNRTLSNTSSYRSFGSLRRKLNLALASPDLFAPPLAPKTFLAYCDFNVKPNGYVNGYDPLEHQHHESINSFNIKSVSSSITKQCIGSHCSNSTMSIESNSSTAAAGDTEFMLSDVVNKFEEVLLDSKCSSKRNIDQESPPSPAPSSCPSSISKTVLTQIRNHLAMSITRVKELEVQVTLIPILKEQIRLLQLERDGLKQTLSIQNNEHEKCTHIRNHLSFVKGESISIHDSTAQTTESQLNITKRSIGTLTSFAPSLLPRRNVLVQTDLKSKDVLIRPESTNVTTWTDMVYDTVYTAVQSKPKSETCDQSIDTDDLIEQIVTPKENKNSNIDAAIQVSLESNYSTVIKIDQCVSTSDLCEPPIVRPTSLDLMIDSSNHSLFHQKSTTSSLDSSMPSVSSQSVRICDKCHQIVNTINDNLSHTDMSAFSFSKIIKSDSGISVERRQVDNKIIEESDNLILVYPASDLEMTSSMNTQSSDEQDSKPNKRKQKKEIDYLAVQPSAETKASLKIINDNLLDPRKSNSFLYSKSVSSIKKIWFKVSSTMDSDSRIVELYLDCFEKFSTKLLDFVVNLYDTSGNTAMHYAISCDNFDIVSVLLDSKVCNVNRYNKAGYTATMLVSLTKIEDDIYRDVVDRLFHQADVNLKAKQNGQTALMLAASHGRFEICKLLLDCGAEINLQDNDGSTALMCAAEHGHPDIISLLLSNPDCDPLMEDNEGSTALKIALVNGHNEVGILLYTGTRITNYFNGNNSSINSCYSSLGRLPNSPILSGHMRRAGSFSYNPGHGPLMHNSSSLSLRTTPPRNRNYSMSTPSSPSSRN